MRTFTFNGIRSDTYFLTNSINRSILPPIDYERLTIPARHGSYPVRSRFVDYEITVEVTLLRESWQDLRDAIRQIASWLYTNEDVPLILSDEPDKFYHARLSGDTDLEEVLAMGEGELTFICSDPFAYSLEEKNLLIVSNPNLYGRTNLDPGDWTDWYQNSILETSTFPSGQNGLTVRMANYESNPRFRIVNASWNTTDVVAGQTYTMSIIFQPDNTVERIEFGAIYYYTDNPQWLTFTPVYVNTLPIESEVDNTRIYTQTFVAEQTGAVRLSFGFGLGNTLINNGSWYRLKQAKLEQGAQMTNDLHVPTTLVNEGTSATYPIIRFVPTDNTVSYFRARKGTKSILVHGPFEAWTPYIVDCTKNLVYNENTSARMMNRVDISSDFFALESGENSIYIENGDRFQVRFIWRNTWL